MKKYVNRSKKQATIELEDGSVQFLRRGQVFTTAKKVVNVRGENIDISEVASAKPVVKKVTKVTKTTKSTKTTEEESK